MLGDSKLGTHYIDRKLKKFPIERWRRSFNRPEILDSYLAYQAKYLLKNFNHEN
jgi:hypothetical protein